MKYFNQICYIVIKKIRRIPTSKFCILCYGMLFLLTTTLLIVVTRPHHQEVTIPNPPPDLINVKYDNHEYTLDLMMSQEEQIYKLANSGNYLDTRIDLTLLSSILKNAEADLPSKNPSIAPMFSDAGSQVHFNNHSKLAEFARLHDKYWKIYYELVELIPKEKHQYNHHNVKNILKASLFSDAKFSRSHKKVLLEFLSSYEILEKKLFHWISPSYESLLELYGTFNKDEYGIAISISDNFAIMGSNVILSIRNVHKSNIPIHVYYVGDSDLSPLNQNMLRSLASNVELHDLSTVIDHSFVQAESYATKVFAQLLTPARHVMLLDADVVLLQSPEKIFSNPGYETHGTLFFHDRQMWEFQPENKKWFLSLLPDKVSDTEPPVRLKDHAYFTNKSAHIQESGVVLIDKIRHLTPLLATTLLNKKVERETTYRLVHGDKETYWMGFEIIGRPYFFSPYEPQPIGDNSYYPTEEEIPWEQLLKPNDFSKPDVFCSCHMLHFDQNQKPLWINGGLWLFKGRQDLGLQDFNSYSFSKNIQWSLYTQGSWGCVAKKEQDKEPFIIKELETEYKAVLKETTALYKSFYNNPNINPLKNV